MKIVVLIALIFLLAGAFIVSADVIPIPIDQCKNLYWFDNVNKSCGQGQFCGTYLYQGLRTFENKTACEDALRVPTDDNNCASDNDCIPITGTGSKCVYGTCVQSNDSSCKNLYWFDNENKSCEKKQFCGAYAYYGLYTYESKTQCEKALNKTPECVTDEDCPKMECLPYETCINGEPKCVDGKCGIGSNLNLTKNCPANSGDESGKCMFNLSNGRKAEVKIMPETASQNAIDRLGELNFTIQLKEVGKGENTKVVYELTGKKQGKFLGIFKIMARVQAQVDANTGDVKVIKPWWSFLASGI